MTACSPTLASTRCSARARPWGRWTGTRPVWSHDPMVQVAVGALGTPESLSGWAQEHLTGFNPHVPYLHTKVLLIGPLSQTPTTVSGSANFSVASTNANDENMLIV